MSDFTMCHPINCPQQDKCYRFLAKSDRFQSYFSIEYDQINGCEYFWKVKEDN